MAQGASSPLWHSHQPHVLPLTQLASCLSLTYWSPKACDFAARSACPRLAGATVALWSWKGLDLVRAFGDGGGRRYQCLFIFSRQSWQGKVGRFLNL